jgi:hypothetical protein
VDNVSYFLSFLLFILQFLAAYSFLDSKLSLILGCGLMILLATSIFLSVKLFFSGTNPVLGSLILFSKIPLTIGSIYLIFQWPELEILSFVIGVLIVLPCLVIVSYRKL